MEHFLETVLSQIRCTKAHPDIDRELRAHIEDQIETNLMSGMTAQQAEQEAVRDMGDPVEIGISLDRVHRPQIAWGMIVLMGVIMLSGILLHDFLPSFVIYSLIGFALMILVLFVDYTRISGLSKPLAAVCLILMLFVGIQSAGGSLYGIFQNHRSMLYSFCLLYVPLYASILYSYRGSGYAGLGRALLWMILPIIFALWMPSIMLAALLLLVMLAQLTLAIHMGWFCIAKKPVVAALWAAVICPVLLLLAYTNSSSYDHLSYRLNRLREWQDPTTYGFLTHQFKTLLGSSFWVGTCTPDIEHFLPKQESLTSFVLVYTSAVYGKLFAVLQILLLLVLTLLAVRLSLKQPNQLGKLISLGCTSVLLIQIILNLGISVSLLPVTQTLLPFFSIGGSGLISSYLLVGIILSTYRYKNIYSNTHKIAFFNIRASE